MAYQARDMWGRPIETTGLTDQEAKEYEQFTQWEGTGRLRTGSADYGRFQNLKLKQSAASRGRALTPGEHAKVTGTTTNTAPLPTPEQARIAKLVNQVKTGALTGPNANFTIVGTPVARNGKIWNEVNDANGTLVGYVAADLPHADKVSQVNSGQFFDPQFTMRGAGTTLASLVPTTRPSQPAVLTPQQQAASAPTIYERWAVDFPGQNPPGDPEDFAVYQQGGKGAYLTAQASQSLPSQFKGRRTGVEGQIDALMKSLGLGEADRGKQVQDYLSQALNLVARQPFDQARGLARGNIESALAQRGLDRSGSVAESLAQLEAQLGGQRAAARQQAFTGSQDLGTQLRNLAAQLGTFRTQAGQSQTTTDLDRLMSSLNSFNAQGFQSSENQKQRDLTQLMQNLQHTFSAGQNEATRKFELDKLLATTPQAKPRGLLDDLGDLATNILKITPIGNAAQTGLEKLFG